MKNELVTDVIDAERSTCKFVLKSPTEASYFEQ